MIKFSKIFFKFTIRYLKFINNTSILFLNENLKISLPLLLKTNKSKNILFFFYTQIIHFKNIEYFHYKKLYINLLLNIFYSLNKSYSITLLLIDKNKDGYKINYQNFILTFKLGKSHDIKYNIKKHFIIKLGRKFKSIKIISNTFQDLVNLALHIRKQRLPEPYKGKGIFFKYEKIKKKKNY
jgi:ribosomal protein L6P/L9E